VGSAVRKLTSESLAEALKKATTDEKQIAKAKIVGEMIQKVNFSVSAKFAKLMSSRRMELLKLSRRSIAIWRVSWTSS